MTELDDVLSAFRDATGCSAAVWVAETGRRAVAVWPGARGASRGTAPRVAHRGPVSQRRSPARELSALSVAGRGPVPPIGARGGARGQRAGRALRGDQPPLHHHRDP